MLLLALLACAPSPEPLELPDDPSVPGAPVGVRTLEIGEQRVELFYPASDADADAPEEVYDFSVFVPEEVAERLGEVRLPQLAARASRDLPLRVPEQPYPALVFSHGFGGMRVQSLDLVTHLASRGYVVLSVDHPGRMLGDVLPCVFSPPLESCDLSASFGDDPAVEDIEDALDWLTAEVGAPESWLLEAVDLERMGLTGHSAGGGTTLELGASDARFDALLPMAAAGVVERDVPTLQMTGSCDYLFIGGEVDDGGTPDDPSDDQVTLEQTPGETIALAAEASADSLGLSIAGTGHLGFSDLCDLELGRLAEEQLAGRDDINGLIYAQLVALATDGCPDARMSTLVEAAPECGEGWLELDRAHAVIRGASTQFFDLHLKGEGAGVDPEAWPEATLYGAR